MAESVSVVFGLMTEDESVDSVRVETRLELLYLMTEDESVDCRYRLVTSNVSINNVLPQSEWKRD